MSTVSALKKEAQEGCKFRGHEMTKFHRVANFTNKEIWRSFCLACLKYVDVVPFPAPNEVEISGTAVGENCYSDGE